jgi:hypothetical protein
VEPSPTPATPPTPRPPSALARLRLRLRATGLFRKALATPIDPILLAPPSPRIVVGLVLLGASYFLGWPAIAILSAIAAWLGRPILLAGGPVLYAFSWVVFAVGLACIGSKSIGTGRAFGWWLLRRFAEKYL